ncbi:Hypothetical_protein [Hexamita inflata]|uniref:Hypothetical_protein n=1 Tax=Hexamita inflata TaxID=28002 RepID=A0AA86P918_9EUKA|nr:Hypothetical protein HINF_LOCUS22024 [Hexamita inflata]
MSVLMRRENTLIIEPGSDISKIQIINFILLPNSKKHFEGPPLYKTIIIQTKIINSIIQTSGQVSSSINAGGIIGYSFNGSITIKDVQVTNTNMSAFSLSSNAHCGSLTAYTTGENIQIENIQISNIYIIVDSPRQYAGVFFSINGFTEFTANLVCSKGINIINGNIVANCQNVINQSQSGC